jgi:hypothetical protein
VNAGLSPESANVRAIIDFESLGTVVTNAFVPQRNSTVAGSPVTLQLSEEHDTKSIHKCIFVFHIFLRVKPGILTASFFLKKVLHNAFEKVIDLAHVN